MNADEIINKVKEKAVQAGTYTAQKASRIVETTKLNYRLYELYGEINEAKTKVGEIVYKAHCGENVDQSKLDELLTEIDAASASVAELRKRISERKNSRACPDCGKVCPRDSQFCPACGREFKTEE